MYDIGANLKPCGRPDLVTETHSESLPLTIVIALRPETTTRVGMFFARGLLVTSSLYAPLYAMSKLELSELLNERNIPSCHTSYLFSTNRSNAHSQNLHGRTTSSVFSSRSKVSDQHDNLLASTWVLKVRC